MTASPCQRICQLENSFCLGCARRIDEIAAWSILPTQKQLQIKHDLPLRQRLLEIPKRQTYRRIADIPDDIRQALSQGQLASASLVEGLAIDFSILLQSLVPNIQFNTDELGILKKMHQAATILAETLGYGPALRLTRLHPSDTVRGISAYLISLTPELSLANRLDAIKDLAADPHFGVREWAWLAMRPHIAANLSLALQLLRPWVESPNLNIRRFAIEILRPRGVWCAHLPELKANPTAALPLLERVKADNHKYVQDSVANWLNDAAKSNPEWVLKICQQWQQQPNPATLRICKRALRSIVN